VNIIENTGNNVDTQKSTVSNQQAVKSEVTSQPPEGAVLQGAVESRANVRDRSESDKPTTTVDIDLSNFHEELEAVVSDVNTSLKQRTRDLEFSIDEQSGERVVLVKDGASGQTIRSIPSETMLRIAHTIQDLRGLLYDDVG
tara:strand:+ start:114 stop:539 length:426 start_codon:yes stop_codon:yes gene_type:complete